MSEDVLKVDFSTTFDKMGDYLQVSSFCCDLKSRRLVFVFDVDVCSLTAQVLNELQMAEVGGEIEWRFLFAVDRVDVSPMFPKEAHASEMTAMCRPVQRRPRHAVRCAGLGALRHEVLQHLEVALLARPVQRCAPVSVPGVHVSCVGADERVNCRKVAVSAGGV